MKINVVTHSPAAGLADSGLQIWDFFVAYNQFLQRSNNYQNRVDIKIGPEVCPEDDAINIAWYFYPTEPVKPHGFDLVILDSMHSYLESANEHIYEALASQPNCYFISGAYVSGHCDIGQKILWTPQHFNLSSYFSRPFYPQYYEKDSPCLPRNGHLLYINGQNRPHRQYFIDCLQKHAPSCQIRNTVAACFFDVQQCFFESDHDRDFRIEVNTIMANLHKEIDASQEYYNNSVAIGIDEKFGRIPPGYFMLDEYYQYDCIMFPESGWINDEILLTEKIAKCFVSKSIPWPVAGANTHALYNEVGYKTAWNLLPDHVKCFDSEPNHTTRYHQQAQAVQWALDHPEIWTSDLATQIREQNHTRFFSNCHDQHGAKKLYEILQGIKK